MSSPPVVDINKLRYLTKTLPQSPIFKDSVDFSDFADKNFEKSVGLTQQSKKVQTVPKKKSKWVYNEVQRNSINFGVSAEEMIAFHNKNKFNQLKSDSNLSKFPDLPKVPPGSSVPESPVPESLVPESPKTPAKRQSQIYQENKENLESRDKPKLRSPFITSRNHFKTNSGDFSLRPNRPFNPRTPPPRPKTNPPRLDIGTPTSPSLGEVPSVIKTPLRELKDSPSLPKSRGKSPSDGNEGNLSRSSSFNLLKRKSSLSNGNNSKDVNSDDWKSKISSSQLRRRLSQASSKASLTRVVTNKEPIRRECHSVEETLLADEEFKDFTIPSRTRSRSSSYYTRTNEFNFEKPLSRQTTISTSLGGSPRRLMSSDLSNRNSMSHFSSPNNYNGGADYFNSQEVGSSPITPDKLRHRHSFGDFQKNLNNIYNDNNPSPSLGLATTRSFSTSDSHNYGSPIRYSPRMSFKTSLSDLKNSPIEKISEHEIMHFGSGK